MVKAHPCISEKTQQRTTVKTVTRAKGNPWGFSYLNLTYCTQILFEIHDLLAIQLL